MKKNIIWQSSLLINNISKKIKINKNGQENYIFFVKKIVRKEAIKIAIETIFQTKIYNIYFVKHSNKDLLNFNKVIIKLEFNNFLQYPKFLQ